jgi:dephospho-CoA kinase
VKHENLYLIGLTGGIACGKSTVIGLLNELGAQTIDADKVTHQVQQPGTPTYAAIVAAFGAGVLSAPGGPIDRRALGAIVFADPARLRELEQIVHPAVRAAIRAWLSDVAGAAAARGARAVAVIDAIKLIESSWASECDAIWVVTCTPAQQVERLMRTRGLSEAEAEARIAAQPPQASRLNHATVVIDNSGPPAAAAAQVRAAWAALGGG